MENGEPKALRTLPKTENKITSSNKIILT